MALPNNPQTRKEMYLSNMAGQGTALPDEPITREEEYLDYIAKNGGGGGTGDGDMKKSVYDSDLDVSGAGGIKAFVNGQTNDLQPKTLAAPITIGGESRTTVEAALGALEDNKEDTILAATPLVKEYDEVMRKDVLRLTMDDTPTASSKNPVKSGGVKSAVTATVDLIKDTAGWLGGNECVNNAVSKSENGVTWTVNADKSISAYGQPTEGDAYIDVNSGANVSANGVAWICNGCPSGGANNKYYSQLRLSNQNGSWYGVRTDTGSGYQLSEAEVTANVKIQYRCIIPSGAPAIPQSSPIVFRPMIISPEQYALNPSYRPYHESVEEMLKYYNVRLQDVANEGSVYDKVVNVAEQLDALVTDIGVKFSGYVLWTQSMFLRVEAIRCNATTLLYTIFNGSYTIYNGAVQNGAVTVYKFEGTQMTS